MDFNHLNSMHGNFPPFNLDFSPSFLYSKKLLVQPLILWENILRGCLASKKIENSREKKKAKDTLYFTKCKIYISWSLGKSSPRVFFQCLQESLYRKVILPFLGYFLAKELHEWLNTRRKWKFRHKNIRRKRVGKNIQFSHVAL